MLSFFFFVTNKSKKSYIHLGRLTLCYMSYMSDSYATGCFFYGRPEHRSCHGISLRLQALYAIKLPCSAKQEDLYYAFPVLISGHSATATFLFMPYKFEAETETNLL
jgi:hypothetical protein